MTVVFGCRATEALDTKRPVLADLLTDLATETSENSASAAAARGAAVEALVAAAVADHDRAAFGAAGGVLLDLEGYVRRAERQGDGRAIGLGAVLGVTVAAAVLGDDTQFRRGRG